MKLILCSLLLIASCAWADEATDREAIGRLIAAFNDHSKSTTDLFTDDAPEIERIALSAHEQPMSEVNSKIIINSVRFITPDVVLVDAANTQYGSVVMARRASLLMVMKRDAGLWRVASLRVLGILSDAVTGR